jgi:hypothetical protein
MKIIRYFCKTILASTIVMSANADLIAMKDNELGNATGEGLGFALEDFVLNSDGASLKVTGIEDSNGGEIDIDWTSFYIMGEGSEKGSINTPGQVGSYLNPWTIQTTRGSRGLQMSDPEYNERYAGIGYDVALLELATGDYENPVQNSEAFAQFSKYQGCVYGNDNCLDLDIDSNGDSRAERIIQQEIAQLTGQKDLIVGRYTGNDLADLESAIVDTYNDDINPLELDVEAEKLDVAAETTISNNAFYRIPKDERDEFKLSLLTIPENCTKWFGSYNCESNAQEDFADTVDDVNEQKEQLRDAKKALNAALNDASLTGVGQSYLTLINDVDEYKSLCGYTDSLAACGDGIIARKEKTRSDVESISVALFNGEARRGGLDIGLTFEFSLNLAGGGTRDDFLDIDMRGVYVDGTSLKLWSRPSLDPASPGSELNAEVRLNLLIKELDIRACDDTSCSTEELREANTLNLDNLLLSLNLGYGDVQPLKFSATSDGQFQLELENPDPTNPYANPDNLSADKFYEDYYKNAPKSFVHIGDVRVGDTSIGSSTISGFRAQYLKVTSRDL